MKNRGTTPKSVNDLTELNPADPAADFVLVWDTSAASSRKVKPNNLGISAGAGGSDTEVQFNNGGSLDGAPDVLIEDGQLRLEVVAAPDAPAAGGLKLFGRSIAGRILPAFIGPSGLDSSLQPYLARNKVAYAQPNGNSTTVGLLGLALSATGTATGANVATTNLHTAMRGIEYLVTTAATTAVAGFRSTAAQFFRGSGITGGFTFICRFGPATGVSTSTNRCFVGFTSATGAPTDVQPSSLTNMVGLGWDAADSNLQIMHNDGSGTATKIDLGGSFPVPTADRTEVYELALFCPPGGSDIYYEVTDLVNGTVATGTISSDMPSSTTLLAPRGWMSVGGTSSVIGIALKSLYIETDY